MRAFTATSRSVPGQIHVAQDNLCVLVEGGDGEHPLLGADGHGEAGVHIQHHHGVHGVGSPPAADAESTTAHDHQGGSHCPGAPSGASFSEPQKGGQFPLAGRRPARMRSSGSGAACSTAVRRRCSSSRSSKSVCLLPCELELFQSPAVFGENRGERQAQQSGDLPVPQAVSAWRVTICRSSSLRAESTASSIIRSSWVTAGLSARRSCQSS